MAARAYDPNSRLREKAQAASTSCADTMRASRSYSVTSRPPSQRTPAVTVAFRAGVYSTLRAG